MDAAEKRMQELMAMTDSERADSLKSMQNDCNSEDERIKLVEIHGQTKEIRNLARILLKARQNDNTPRARRIRKRLEQLWVTFAPKQ